MSSEEKTELPAPANVRSFVFETSILDPLGPKNYLIPELNIGPGHPVGFFAYSWSGKSIIVQDLVLSVATGTPVFGQFLCKRGSTVRHIDHEQGRHETLDRYQRLARARGITAKQIDGRIGVVSLPQIFLNSKGAEDAYKRAFDKIDLGYIDSLGASQPGVKENESAFAEGLYMLGRVSQATGTTILIVGHTGKSDLSPDKNPDGRVSPRGTSAIIGACSTAFALSGGKGEPKLVNMIKGRSLGGAQVEDFYLDLSAPRIDGYKNIENVADPGGFLVKYKTLEQIKPPKAPGADLEETILRVVKVIGESGEMGVPGADAVAAVAGMGAPRTRSAVKVALDRSLIENIAKLKNGAPDERHPRFRVPDAARHSSTPKGVGRVGRVPAHSSGASKDESDESDECRAKVPAAE